MNVYTVGGVGSKPFAARVAGSGPQVVEIVALVDGYSTGTTRRGSTAPHIPGERDLDVYRVAGVGQRFPFTARLVAGPTVVIGAGGSRVNNEIPSGALNGVNTTFTLSQPFAPGSTAVYLNGVRLKMGASFDYTESAPTTLNLTFAPVSSDHLLVDYLLATS